MITLIIPPQTPESERRKALAKAKQQFHRARMQVSATIRKGDLRAYAHARRGLKRSREMVRAWSAVQSVGDAA